MSRKELNTDESISEYQYILIERETLPQGRINITTPEITFTNTIHLIHVLEAAEKIIESGIAWGNEDDCYLKKEPKKGSNPKVRVSYRVMKEGFDVVDITSSSFPCDIDTLNAIKAVRIGTQANMQAQIQQDMERLIVPSGISQGMPPGPAGNG